MSTVPTFTVITKTEAQELKPSSKPLSAMTKIETSGWLRSLGEEPRATWTNLEIKSRIQEILDSLAEDDGKLPKNMSGMKKADLQRECKERNIPFTEQDIKGTLMRKLREQVETEKDGPKKEAETRKKTANARPTMSAASMTRTPDSGNPRVKRMSATAPDADDMRAETPLMEELPLPRNSAEAQILGALEKINTRLTSLETTQAQPAQPEKMYPATASESWKSLSTDGGAVK